MQLLYKKRRTYKYTLAAPYCFETKWKEVPELNTPYIELKANGSLQIKTAYSWDGASGPMPDLASIMRASLIHDALYQLMREQHLPASYRKAADRLLLNTCLADGMNSVLAHWVYACVRCFAQRYIKNEVIAFTPPTTYPSPSTTEQCTLTQSE
ncbi:MULTISPECIES: DUF1353 domain-containing protein [Deefgea]|uniref:DUF1353 domain-containing protein n=1 Tax=Deefgea TaxID=400947 RepID=UPI0019440301|nr:MULTISPECIES: DUF1353 domain-containing protein [Deefgea]